MPFELTDWKKVFPLKAEHLQEPVTALRQLATLLGDGVNVAQTSNGTTFSLSLPANIIGYFLGITIDKGPNNSADWTDERVWVQPLGFDVLNSSNPGSSAQLKLYPVQPPKISGQLASPYPVCATNLVDVASHAHSLAKGTPVFVVAVLDHQNPPRIHYVIPSSGGGGSLPAPQFQYQILTGVSNGPTWDVRRFAPKIPNAG